VSTPGRAGRMSLSLSPIVHGVDVELGPTQRGLEGHGRSAYLPLYPPGSHWTNSPCCWGFSTRDRFPAPLSHSALLTCRLSPRLLGGSRRVVSARLVMCAAFMARVGALAAVRVRVNALAGSMQTFAQTEQVSAYILPYHCCASILCLRTAYHRACCTPSARRVKFSSTSAFSPHPRTPNNPSNSRLSRSAVLSSTRSTSSRFPSPFSTASVSLRSSTAPDEIMELEGVIPDYVQDICVTGEHVLSSNERG
jgi:hypothetical protein